MNPPFSKWKLLALIAGTVLVADQVTKYLAVAHLTWAFETAHAQSLGEKVSAFLTVKDPQERGPVRVIDQVWQHRYAENRGAAWGIFNNAAEKFRVPFFYLVSIGAVIFIFAYYRKLSIYQRYLQIALALVLGGALGNALDRVVRGYVIDFIDWHWFDPNWMRPGRHWPTFNVADSGISTGLVLLFLEMLLVKKPAAQTTKKVA